MATVVNNPAPQQNSGGFGFIIVVVFLIVSLGLLVTYGIPALQSRRVIQVNVPTPEINVEAPQVNVEAPANPTE